MTSWDLWAMGAVLLMGVPHGGLDGAIARRIGWPKGLIAWLGFNLCYVALAALVVWVWWQWPLVGLQVFLIISALHFGASDIVSIKALTADKPMFRWLPLTAHGGFVSIAIPSLQALQVQPSFSLLVGDVAATMLIQSIILLFLPWLACFVAYCVYAAIYPVWRKPLLDLSILLMFAFTLPPLITFALYFCVWHSRCHMLRILNSIKGDTERRRSLIEAMAYSLIAWMALGVVFVLFQESFTSALMQVTFIGLAALTVPHMLLVDLADKLKPSSSWQ